MSSNDSKVEKKVFVKPEIIEISEEDLFSMNDFEVLSEKELEALASHGY